MYSPPARMKARVRGARSLCTIFYALIKIIRGRGPARTSVSVALSCGSVRVGLFYDRNDMWSALTQRLALLCADKRQKREFILVIFN